MKSTHEPQQPPPEPEIDTFHKEAIAHDSKAELIPRWTAIIGVLVIGILYFALSARLTFGPSWLLLALEVPFLLPLIFSRVTRRTLPHRTIRFLALALLAIITAGLAASIALLVIELTQAHSGIQANTLLHDAGLLWFSNILVFGLWYWEIDGGGPRKRHEAGHQAADFMFPQQADGNKTGWAPQFADYLFVAFTGATALSPADTYPLTQQAKLLMMIEAILSLTIIVLLAARAVNILGS